MRHKPSLTNFINQHQKISCLLMQCSQCSPGTLNAQKILGRTPMFTNNTNPRNTHILDTIIEKKRLFLWIFLIFQQQIEKIVSVNNFLSLFDGNRVSLFWQWRMKGWAIQKLNFPQKITFGPFKISF